MLLGQRRAETSGLRRSEINQREKLWTLPTSRYKTSTMHEVPLSDAAWDIIAAAIRERQKIATGDDGQPPAEWDAVFVSGRADTPIRDYSMLKERIDKKIAELQREQAKVTGDKVKPLTAWGFHDLRRTLRTRLSALGVRPDIAEMVIGHSRQGMQAVYDLHAFRSEKRASLNLWATALARIVEPIDNVVVLGTARASNE
jgi:integrase